MPDSKLPIQPDPSFDDLDPNPDDYTILRKGSVYNIQGPYGREFGKYKSASTVGPRWEELTHTPWPFESSAYQSGLRLWELGIIRREHVGMRKLLVDSAPHDQVMVSETDEAADPAATDPPPETPAQMTTASTEETDSSPPEPTNPYHAQVDTPPEPVKPPPQPAPPRPRRDSKPRQQRLMFQENWDDHRDAARPKKPTDRAASDADSSESQQSARD